METEHFAITITIVMSLTIKLDNKQCGKEKCLDFQLSQLKSAEEKV